MEKVPLDVRKEIARFLDDTSRRLMRLANTEWFNIIHYNNFSLFSNPSMLPTIVDRFANYSWPISIHFLRRSRDTMSHIIQNVSKLTNLQRLIFDDELEVRSEDEWLKLTSLSNIEEMDFGLDIPVNLIKQLPSLKVWKIPETKDELPEQIQLKNLTNLEQLTGVYDPLWLSIIPNPTRLTKLIVNMSDSELKFNELEIADLKINERNDNAFNRLPQLEALEVMDAPFVPNLQSNTNLTHLKLYQSPSNDYGSISALRKLKIIEFVWPLGWKHEQASFLTALTDLRSAFFHFDERQSSDIDKSLQFLSEKLKDLYVISFLRIDLQFIQKLTNLNALTVRTAKNASFLAGLTNLTQLHLDLDPEENFDLSAIGRLIKLKELSVTLTTDSQISEQKFPYLDLLKDLTSIKFGAIELPPIAVNRVLSVTSLEQIQMQIHENEKELLIDFSLIPKLVALKDLDLNNSKVTSEQFWNNLALATQLESLCLANIDRDCRIESLVNLLELQLAEATESFTGESLTKLTALQSLYYGGNHPLTVTKEELRSKMSNLVDIWFSAVWE